MATIVNSALAGFTVTYNGVQFGGADAPGIALGNNVFRSTPPMYAFRSTFRYDESGRAIVGIDHSLTVRCMVFESDESILAQNVIRLRALLGVPGRSLKIEGTGSGFGVIEFPSLDYWDLDHGPKPMSLELTPIGAIAFELTWVVKFFISECATTSTHELAFLAFNFNTTWENDFEGIVRRTIAGHVIIPQMRATTFPDLTRHVAEETRGSIIVSVPPNFRRVTNNWRESTDKSRLDFTIVDEQLPGDVLPVGVTTARGTMSFTAQAGEKNASMVQGTATLSMALRTAPNQPRNLAGEIFLLAALAKQTKLSAIDDATGKATVTVIPVHLSIVNGKFDDSRDTNATMSWLLVSNLSKNLSAANIYMPINDLLTPPMVTQDYTAWRASMASLWDNRGFAGIGSVVGESHPINLCSNTTAVTIGVASSTPNSVEDASLPSLTCPAVPDTDDGGWLHYSLSIEIRRYDSQSTHKRAAAYVPQSSTDQQQQPDPGTGTTVLLGGPAYSQPPSDYHVTEFHGYPEVYLGLSFSGLRFNKKPDIPEVKSIDGQPVIAISTHDAPQLAFDVFGCKVWRNEGFRLYRVDGPISKAKYAGSILTTGTPIRRGALPLVL
jgi:hypothetical protein